VGRWLPDLFVLGFETRTTQTLQMFKLIFWNSNWKGILWYLPVRFWMKQAIDMPTATRTLHTF